MSQTMEDMGLAPNSLVRFEGSPTGTCIVLSGSVDRGFVSCNGANSRLMVDSLPLSVLMSAKHVHFHGYFNLPALQSPELVQLLMKLRAKGITTSLDTQWDASEEWEGANKNLHDVLKHLDVFLPSEEELQGIAKEPDSTKAARLVGGMMSAGSLVVVKCGVRGAFALQSDTGQVLARENAYPATVVDTTGAGDAFDAGFISVQVNGGSVAEALKFGCASGGRRVEIMSASDNPPTMPDLEDIVGSKAPVSASNSSLRSDHMVKTCSNCNGRSFISSKVLFAIGIGALSAAVLTTLIRAHLSCQRA